MMAVTTDVRSPGRGGQAQIAASDGFVAGRSISLEHGRGRRLCLRPRLCTSGIQLPGGARRSASSRRRQIRVRPRAVRSTVRRDRAASVRERRRVRGAGERLQTAAAGTRRPGGGREAGEHAASGRLSNEAAAVRAGTSARPSRRCRMASARNPAPPDYEREHSSSGASHVRMSYNSHPWVTQQNLPRSPATAATRRTAGLLQARGAGTRLARGPGIRWRPVQARKLAADHSA